MNGELVIDQIGWDAVERMGLNNVAHLEMRALQPKDGGQITVELTARNGRGIALIRLLMPIHPLPPRLAVEQLDEVIG